MPDYPSVRFIHRYVPLDRICYWLGAGIPLLGCGIWVIVATRYWELAVLLFAGALGVFLWIGFLRTLTFLVNDDGLTIIKRPLVRIFASYAFFAPDDIRSIRLRSDIYEHSGGSVDWKEPRYFLDVITTDSNIINLVTSSEFPLPRDLGRKLAEAVGSRYEEYLHPGCKW